MSSNIKVKMWKIKGSQGVLSEKQAFQYFFYICAGVLPLDHQWSVTINAFFSAYDIIQINMPLSKEDITIISTLVTATVYNHHQIMKMVATTAAICQKIIGQKL